MIQENLTVPIKVDPLEKEIKKVQKQHAFYTILILDINSFVSFHFLLLCIIMMSPGKQYTENRSKMRTRLSISFAENPY